VKNRQTREVVVGAVTGPIERPVTVIAGAFRDSELAVIGRTVPLTAAQSADLAAHLSPASDDHPWPDELSTGVFGQRERVCRDLTLRPACMPMNQDLCHVDHVETSPRHQAPVCTLQREQPVCYEDRTDDATHVIPVGKYVIVDLGNFEVLAHFP
jgi:hypothetical protein